MQAHTVERVESWDSRPFSGGFRELHELADREFSGTVVADGTWLFMLNGRVIGVFEGDVEDFEDASGTVYEAPDPSLALLFAMQERGGETQAKYYTNDTPLSAADETLADANFTGYVELSENVLSGDYYVVYYGGRSMSAAFVGASEELVTGEEAFERADDEVGVYEVRKTPVNVTSIPEVDDGSPADDAAGGAAAGGAAAPDRGSTDDASPGAGASEASAGDSAPEDAAAGEPSTDRERASEASRPGERTASSSGPGGQSSSADAGREAEGADADATATDATAADAARPDRAESDGDAAAAGGAGAAGGAAAEGGEGDGDPAPKTGEARTGNTDRVFDEEEQWRNATSVPTLDPEQSETDGGAEAANAGGQSRSTPSKKRSRSKRSPGQSAPDRATSAERSRQSSGASGKPQSTVEKLKRAVKQRDAKLEEAAGRIEDLEGERDDLRERAETLREERDELQARVEELEADLAAAETADERPSAGEDLSPAAALSGTNLFVRYDSKGKPTLDGLDGNTDPSAVNDNLRIDHHTQFDAAEATVDGEDYEAFLRSSAPYRFVSWAVRELPYEVRDAGHANGLADLYDAIPEVDRAELDGTVEVETEDGSVTESFDVVLRDRMGNPLVVAELNAERDPVTGVEMDDLVDAATAVREGADDLSAAVYVTASFFEPAALETAAEETASGGFLSRSDKLSYVSTGRKAGYHLCLVEDRNDAFNLTVPEL
ncbi:DUF7527 domain-containing protein [Halobacterium yunchengense]|uniref:DUF7527 domain-containing protein n=1 Tax=Halobacterium yunchengense TaxID=3108497 RepID=UPI0030083863